ncbi:hypothetical protein CR513_21178, partial [Mucuna pruriens]
MTQTSPWYEDIYNYLIASMYPQGASKAYKDKLGRKAKFYIWDDPFDVPKVLINNQGSHFCNRAMAMLLEKYGVVHRVAIAYHPQTNDQAESTEHTGRSRSEIWPMTKLAESRNYNYKSCKSYARRLMRILGSTRKRPFVETNVFPYGVVEVRDIANNHTFKVNGNQLKPYHEGLNLSSTMGEVEIITLIELVILEDPPEEVPDSLNSLSARGRVALGTDWSDMVSIETYLTRSRLSADKRERVGCEFSGSVFHDDRHGRMVKRETREVKSD